VEDRRGTDERRVEGGIPQRVLDTILRWATWRNILILWAVFVAFNLLVVGPAYSRIETLSGGVEALDFLIVYRPEKAFERVAAYGAEGRPYYATIALTVDTLFPLLMALTFGLTLARLYRRAFSREGVLHRALFVPLGTMVADLLENVGIVTMLLSHPRRPLAVALLTSSFSTVKWTAATAESLLIVIGLIAWLVNALRGGDTEA